MTVNKKKWQEIAEKYDTKAKWAEAIILLNPEDHEDLISALIELDPQDIAGPRTSTPADVTSIQENLKVMDQILADCRAQQSALAAVVTADYEELRESLDTLSVKLGDTDIHYHFSINGEPMLTSEEIARLVADTDRDTRSL